MGLYSRDASTALTIERYNVNNAIIAGHGEGSKDVPSVALFLTTKTNIRRSVKCGQP